MSDNNYTQRLSAAITWLRFPLIFFIILLHCYSVVRLEGHEVYFKTLYPLTLWIGESGVPGFFFISGLLFFMSKKSYEQKLKSRVHTLLIPYLLWNGMLLCVYLLAFAAGHPQDILQKNMADYTFTDYLRLFWDRGSFGNGNSVPLLCPFWYIRNLMVMCILSPLVYYIVKYLREAFLAAVTIWWIFLPGNGFIPQTVLFFCLGAYFPIHGLNPLEVAIRHKRLVLAIGLTLAFGDIWSHSIVALPYMLQIHRLSLLMNIPMLLLLADACCRRHFTVGWMPNAAFIVFSIHYPITVILRKICVLKYGYLPDLPHILFYFGCVVITTALSLLFYFFLDKYFPKAKDILSGNR